MLLVRSTGRQRHRTVLIATLGALLTACSGAQGTRSSRLAVDLEVAGATGSPGSAEVARRALADASSDLEVRCAAWLALGRIGAREGTLAEALEWLARVGRECASLPRTSSEALWEVASITTRLHPGSEQAVLERVASWFPDQPAAARAVRELAAKARGTEEVRRTVARFRELHRRTEGREVAPVILWEAARLLAVEPARASRLEALGLYRLLARRYPRSGLRDDALWAAGNLALELGDPREALECFVDLRGLREWSFLFGSYERPLYQEALRGMARAFLGLGRPREASRALEILARERPREARDLLEEAASIREDGGDPDGAAVLRKQAGESHWHPRPMQEPAQSRDPDP